MSKLTRILVIGATLTAMHLAGLTAVAHASRKPVMAKRRRAVGDRRSTPGSISKSRPSGEPKALAKILLPT